MTYRFASTVVVLAVVAWITGAWGTANADTYTSKLIDVWDGLEEEFPPSEHDPGLVRVGSRDFELDMEGIAPDERPTDTPQHVFLRYENLQIPKGSMINSARVQFTSQGYVSLDPENDEVASLTIYGVADPNQPRVSSLALDPPCPNMGAGGGNGCFYLSNRPRTSSSVDWLDIPQWPDGTINGMVIAGSDQRTPDVSPIVREIIGMDGWQEGNAMAFLASPKVLGVILDENGTVISTEYARGSREAAAFAYRWIPMQPLPFPAGYFSPELTIDFTPPILGDLDCDGDVDFDDIDDFVLGLNNPQAYEDLFGLPPDVKGDLDTDGDLDFDDIPGFVAVLSGGGAQAVPEPSTLLLAGLAALGCLRLAARSRRRGTAPWDSAAV